MNARYLLIALLFVCPTVASAGELAWGKFHEYDSDRGTTAALAGGSRGTRLPDIPLGSASYYGGTAWNVISHRFEAIPAGTWTFDSGVGSAINVSGTGGKPAGYHSSMEGWTGDDYANPAVGDFTNLSAVSDLPPVLDSCPCALSDSVLTFFDTSFAHPTGQVNVAWSPWIQIQSADIGRPGHFVVADGYFEMPLKNYVVLNVLAQWSTTQLGAYSSDLLSYYFGQVPRCTTPGEPLVFDLTHIIPANVTEVRIGFMVVSLGSFLDATGVTNSTPWLDNVRFGVYGSAGDHLVRNLPIDRFQDNFATDGTLNPASTVRVDINYVTNMDVAGPNARLGDTLVVRGDAGDTEVQVVFHVRPGPMTNVGALTAWASKWTAQPSIGPGWYSARMDTAESGPIAPVYGRHVHTGIWMGTFHESDPGFSGSDTAQDPLDQDELNNEIFPDRILTAGSRIDYYFRARRASTGGAWTNYPDPTGGNTFEIEMLPSSLSSIPPHNSVLYVDHHDDRDFGGQYLEEAGLDAALGVVPGPNAEGRNWDRYDVVAASNWQGSLGRPAGSIYGATLEQLSFYTAIAWHSGNLASRQLTDEDAGVLTPWLTQSCRGFWGTGNDLVEDMAPQPVAGPFMTGSLGTNFVCSTLRDPFCPVPSGFEPAACIPLANVLAPAPAFLSAPPDYVTGNSCPEKRSFSLLSPSGPGALGQLDYLKLGGRAHYESVTNQAGGYRTLLEGAAVGYRVAPGGCFPFSLARSVDGMAWLGHGSGVLSGGPVDQDKDGVSDAEESGAPNAGDGNLDTIPDATQCDVVSVASVVTGQYFTLQNLTSNGVRYCGLSCVQSIAASSIDDDPPPGVSFPCGLLSFTITGVPVGDIAEFEILVPSGCCPTKYYKFGPTAGNTTPHWYDFTSNVIINCTAGTITLSIQDGGLGDDDLMANGVIVDAGGPAMLDASGVPSEPADPTPTTFRLEAGRPNPFHGSSEIEFELAADREPVRLMVFDLSGRMVRQLVNDRLARGVHRVTWDGRDDRGQVVPAGLYWTRLEAGAERQIRKICFVR